MPTLIDCILCTQSDLSAFVNLLNGNTTYAVIRLYFNLFHIKLIKCNDAANVCSSCPCENLADFIVGSTTACYCQ